MEDRNAPELQRERSLGATLGYALHLAQQVAADELRLLQLESQDGLARAARRGAWTAFGALCLLIGWIGLLAAIVVALEGRLPLELRLLLVAASQLVLGAALIAFGRHARSGS
jgi:hypothetical protein